MDLGTPPPAHSKLSFTLINMWNIVRIERQIENMVKCLSVLFFYRLGWESAIQALSANQHQQQQQQQHHADLKKSNLAEDDLMYKMDGR